MSSSGVYVVYYWGIGFRGNFIKCLLDYADVSYADGSVQDLVQLKQASPIGATALFMAPPLLYDVEKDFYISQTTAIVTYLARKHNLAPSSLQDMATAEKILADCNDVLNEITRNCGAQMWDKESWEEFMKSGGRFEKWLQIMEETATRAGLGTSSGYFLNTPEATFVDTSIYALWATMERSVPELRHVLRHHAPRVMSLCDRLGENPRLVSLFQRQPAIPYCGGQIEKSLREVVADWAKQRLKV